MAWQSIHIFYQQEQDDLLLECIEPITKRLKKDGLITQHFFLRYWKQGPHIRLRFFVPDNTSSEHVASLICNHITEYLVQHPSNSELDIELYKQVQTRFSLLERETPVTMEIAPNNSWRIEPYEPEYTKYGGRCGVAIAEELFDSSTSCAFLLLSEMRTTPTKRLNIGFMMLLLGISRFGIPLEEMPVFLKGYQQFWSHYVIGSMHQVWQKKLEKHWDTLQKQAYALLFHEDPLHLAFEEWQDALYRASIKLHANRDEVLEAITLLAGPEMQEKRKQELLLVNYLHTHNNRLGIYPGDEAYLAFLGEQIVKSIIK